MFDASSLSHSPGFNREVQAAIIVPLTLLSPRGLHFSALRSDWATLLQATHSDSGQPEADQRRQADTCLLRVGWKWPARTPLAGWAPTPARPSGPDLH